MVANVHLGECYLPAYNEVAEAERLGVTAFVAAVEYLAVDEAALVVYCYYVAATWTAVALAALEYLYKHALRNFKQFFFAVAQSLHEGFVL